MVPLALVVALGGIAAAARALPDDPAAGVAVARIGSEQVTRGEYGAWLVEQYGVMHLRDFVEQRLVLRAAADQGVLPPDAEIAAADEAEVARIVQEFHRGDVGAYEADVRRRGYEPATWQALRRGRLRVELAAANLARLRRDVDEAAIAERFATTYGRTGTDQGEHVVIEVLLFDMYAGADPDGGRPDPVRLKAAARERAERAAAALADGAPLSEVAPLGDPVRSEFVVDGRVDPYRRLLLGPEVERALTSLDEAGETSPPVAVYNGFYVVRLVERRPVTLEATRAALQAELRAAPATAAEIMAVREQVFAGYDAELLLR